MPGSSQKSSSSRQTSSTRVAGHTIAFAKKTHDIKSNSSISLISTRTPRINKYLSQVYSDLPFSGRHRSTKGHAIKDKLLKLKPANETTKSEKKKRQRSSLAPSVRSRFSGFSIASPAVRMSELPSESQQHLMKLRADYEKEERTSDQEYMQHEPYSVIEEDEYSDDDILGTDSDSEYEDQIGPDGDKIEALRRSFRKSAHILEKREAPITIKDFFEELGDMPSIGDISSDVTIDFEEELKSLLSRRSTYLMSIDAGKFVDPVTGVALTSSSSSVTAAVTAVPSKKELSMDQLEASASNIFEIELEEDEDLADDDDTGGDFQETKPKKTVQDFDLEKLLNIQPIRTDDGEVKFDPTTTEEYMRKVRAEITEYVMEIINNVVNSIEYGISDRFLSENLDKKDVMSKLEQILGKLEIEQKTNLYLNHAVVDVMRKKGEHRYLKADDPKQVMGLIDKNIEIKDKLSDLLCQEEMLKQRSFQKVSELTELTKEAEIIANQSIDKLEILIHRAFHREHLTHLNEFITYHLKRMSKTRDEISNQRYLYLQKLHTLSDLEEKSQQLEDIGDNLTMHNFELLQARTTALALKNDERKNDLTQLRTQNCRYVHILSHIRECTCAMRNKLVIKESALEDLYEELSCARKDLNYQKKIRRGLRNDIGAVQLQSGLTGNDVLIMDYDKTSGHIKDMKSTIDQLKQELKQLEARYSRLEQRLRKANPVEN